MSSSKKLLWAVLLALAPATAAAAPLLRQRVDQRGDFVILGNTVAHECAAGTPAPVVGTVGACGIETGETSPDVHWRAEDASATASVAITPAAARSTSVLRLPAGASVTYARLYWSSARSGNTTDTSVVVDRPGLFTTQVTADATTTVTSTTPPTHTYYQSSADVTALVQARGPGAYRVGDIDTISLPNLNDNRVYVAWTMVVFYRLDSEPPRNLTLFDGLDLIENNNPQVTVQLRGFLVPNAGFDGKLAVVAYEGDADADGDSLSFNGTMVSNATNPVDNFFNSSRTSLGLAVSVVGDLPQLTGAAGSMSGYDQDVVNVTSLLTKGDTTATIRASTSGEFFILGVFVTSISTFRPDFTTTGKTFANLTRNDGSVRPGDTLEYTITTRNDGNDPGVGVTLTDALPNGVTFVPGSIRISAGANTGAKTDAAGDDQAEYVAANRTVTARLGTGATGGQGGTIAPGESATLTFRVTVNAMVTGTISNQAIVTAAGQSGAPATNYPSDGNGPMPGTPPTTTPIDDCLTNADCPMGRICNTTAHPYVCAECRANADCTNPVKPICNVAMGVCRACAADAECPMATPVCHSSGRCVECTPQSMARCTGAMPLCHPTQNVCVGCRDSTDCRAPTPVCDTAAAVCVECLTNANCTAPGRPLCDPATKTCRGGCLTSADCAGATPLCSGGACVPCMADGAPSCPDPRFPACQRSGPLAGWCTECSATNSTRCGNGKPQCLTDLGICGCSDRDGDAECGDATSGIVCNAPAGICVPGCAAAPRNGCPAGQTCSSMTAAIGSCLTGMCTGDADCRDPSPRCDLTLNAPRCVQCLMDTDCKGGFVCSPQRTCVECLPGRPDACMNASAGSRCLANNTCGCQANGDCMTARSGRICNSDIAKCTTMAAPDGGAPDAARDAGAPDVGRDAGAPETARDAPAPDAPADSPVADARPRDAGLPDAAAPAEPDAGAPVAETYLAGGGCKCDLGGRGSGGPWAALVLLGAAGALRRRRRQG